MNFGPVDTSFERNVKRISPFLGVLLIGAFALFIFMMISSAMQSLTQSLHTDAPVDVNGTIRLAVSQPLQYGDTVEFRSHVQGAEKDATVYITTACFQGEKMVYQRSAQAGVSFSLSDQFERDLEWDGGPASCSATLMYRTVGDEQVDVYILNAVSFDVIEQ